MKGSSKMLLLLLLLTMSQTTFGGSACQTSWSGGRGVHGPVTDWASEFYSDSGVRSYVTPSDLSLDLPLESEPIETMIASEFAFPNALVAADMDSDGFMDVASVSLEDDLVSWWRNEDGTGTGWSEFVVMETIQSPRDVSCGDFNGDGRMDLAVVSAYEQKVSWLENVEGSSMAWPEHVVLDDCYYVSSVIAVDIDQDGHTDIATAGQMGYNTYYFRNTDGTGMNWDQYTVEDNLLGVLSLHS